ncbi:arsenate reductase/protein-tyrosine-phosphatase family protein [Nocardioides flavescens]|uniref:protein-tyrosine-phosphatase n=1 Tax=Nocardioides flavescens TaxID=2691959 RepID=A0A6L7EZH7_9ACTN|nr:low molecular weight phosphotyrosine protein phosphatase [Nocardioides flavescens]
MSWLPPPLPAPRQPGRYAVALVCLGNICRSPIADVVLSERVDEAGLAGHVTVASSGTGGWHVGDPMDPRAASVLLAHDYDPSLHRARQFAASWLEEHDLVLCMDARNLEDVTSVRGEDSAPDERLRLFGDFDPVTHGAEVPDPYYGGPEGFEEVLAMVERTCATIVSGLQRIPGLTGRS